MGRCWSTWGDWPESDDARKRALGARWQAFLNREIPWKNGLPARNLVFGAADAERSSFSSRAEFVERELRANLPPGLADLPLRVDLARHIHRPDTRGPSLGQNFLFDPARNEPRPLADDQLFRQLPLSHRICRIMPRTIRKRPTIVRSARRPVVGSASDDLTNM